MLIDNRVKWRIWYDNTQSHPFKQFLWLTQTCLPAWCGWCSVTKGQWDNTTWIVSPPQPTLLLLSKWNHIYIYKWWSWTFFEICWPILSPPGKQVFNHREKCVILRMLSSYSSCNIQLIMRSFVGFIHIDNVTIDEFITSQGQVAWKLSSLE